MSARILIVDSVATNRIVLKVKLLAAQYQVIPCVSLAEARKKMNEDRPDMILIDVADQQDAAFEMFRTLKEAPETATIPIVVLGSFPTPDFRQAALEAGADDVLHKPLHDTMLQARIRNLLRNRDAAQELQMREDTHRTLGFAEASEPFEVPSKVAVIGISDTGEQSSLTKLETQLGHPCQFYSFEDALGTDMLDNIPDVLVIDGTGANTAMVGDNVYRLISEMRTRTETRHAAQMVILPECMQGVAAMALDIGANDLVTEPYKIGEIAIRINTLMRRKKQQDRLRDTVRDGLKAAVTDPLTGLFNRRYSVPHLSRMADKARENGRDFAMMVLDIDHFKSINDTYGHAVGDKVLIGVARRLSENLRAVDLAARIGGEEFLVAMPDTDPGQARQAAERLRKLIEETPFHPSETSGPIDVTLSIGVAMGSGESVSTEDVEEIFDRADAALYAAKTAGRNAVTMALSAA